MFQPNQSTFSNSVMDKAIGIDPILAVQGVGKIVVEVRLNLIPMLAEY